MVDRPEGLGTSSVGVEPVGDADKFREGDAARPATLSTQALRCRRSRMRSEVAIKLSTSSYIIIVRQDTCGEGGHT